MTLIILDLEATCWDEKTQPIMRARQRTESEVIEIGALRVDPTGYTVIDEFQRFVRPVHHPTLTEFCVGLTGITQSDVAQAQAFAEAWAAFIGWTGDLSAITMGSWGAFDHEQLTRQCGLLGLPAPGWSHRNIKHELTVKLRNEGNKRGRMGLSRALRYHGLDFAGNAHRALDDAKNVVRIMAAAKL